MNTAERRGEILKILHNADAPVAARELAGKFGVSRQAVYDNIKRTEKILEDYEMKLHMYSDYIVRSQIFDQISDKYPDDAYLQEQIAVLSSIDNRE